MVTAFAAAMEEVAARGAPWPGAVAVSGGADSLALMLLLEEWATERKKPAPVVLTVNHGLRPSSRAEARQVVKRATDAGLKAHTLSWRGAKPSSDVEAKARIARYRLMGAWCRTHGICGLYVAHTLEDQAETFLLRLARGSGLDGLSAMAAVARFPLPQCRDLLVVRPLLRVRRGELRRVLETRKETWQEDPMNSDPRYARARLRAAWPLLEGLGLVPSRIVLAADHLSRARCALERETEALLARTCRFAEDHAVVDGAAWGRISPEIGLRALAAVLMRVSENHYRPRFSRLERLFCLLRGGKFQAARTLHGCRIASAPKRHAVFGPETLIVARERKRNRTRVQSVDSKTTSRRVHGGRS